ncbi:hypothetical protein PMm318_A23450 [Pseudomonas moorei]
MLSSQQNFIGPGDLDEHTITGIPGRTLEAGARLNLHPTHVQWHLQCVTHRPAMIRPGISHRLKTVMDMNGTQWRHGFGFREFCEKVQQDGGVETTGERDVPGFGVAPGREIQEKSGGQINI